MSVQVENLEKNMAKLTIEVPAEELEKALEKAYQKQKKNISVPGFRKGKVPRAMVEKMYGPAVFYEDAVNSLVPEEYSKAAEESKLDIVSRPEINVEQIEKGKAFIFTATVAVKPEVTLGEYKGLEVAKADTTVTDEEVEAKLKEAQEQNAREITVEDRAVQDGDIITLNYAGTVDGVAFDGGTAENQQLVIGSHTFIDNFEEQLIGVEIGGEKDVEVTVFDHGPGQATKAAAGIISPWFSKRRNKAWYRMARLGADFYQELTSNLENDGYDTSFYDQSGVVLLKKDDGKLDGLYQYA